MKLDSEQLAGNEVSTEIGEDSGTSARESKEDRRLTIFSQKKLTDKFARVWSKEDGRFQASILSAV